MLGAGDAFMSGFLRGWLTDEPFATCADWANAAGALVVSRAHVFAPESPTFAELRHFLDHGSPQRALRKDPALNHIHWATTRRPVSRELMVFAFDHRKQMEEMVEFWSSRASASLLSSNSRSRPRAESHKAGPAMACCSTAPMARMPCSWPGKGTCGSPGRSAAPVAPARLRGRCRSRLAPGGVAGDADGEVPLPLSPGRRRRVETPAASRTASRRRCGPHHRPRTADRGDRTKYGPMDERTAPHAR